MNYKGQY